MTMRRALKCLMVAATIWTAMLTPALADTFPSSPVTIVVPFPPGGGTDALARGLAVELAKRWKQSVVIENVGGANSIIGTGKVARAAPDGLTLLITIDSTVVHNRFLYKKLPYDPDKSLVPVTMIAKSGQLLIATPSFPANNMRELIEIAHRTPAGIEYGSTGPGTQPHLLFEVLAHREGVNFLQVPYKGINPIVTAVMTGEVKLSTASPASAGPMLEAGSIKAIGIGGDKRSVRFPNVPTLAEQGFADLNATTWWGMFAPAGTNPAIVEQINRDVAAVARDPAFVERNYTAFGVEPVLDTPAAFAAAIRRDVDITGAMVKIAGVTPQD
jgi:tripartite-type tricarboxylate transporter receptor subunit TctC